jgi:hypothetical protein
VTGPTNASVDAVAHEVRSMAGAVRLLVSTVRAEVEDAELAALLEEAERNTVKVAAAISALPALVAARRATGRRAFDVMAAARQAEREAAAAGVNVIMPERPGTMVTGTRAAFVPVLAALLRLVGSDGDATVDITVADGSATVTVDGSGASVFADTVLVDALTAAARSTRRIAGVVTITLPVVE